jgi:histidinol-phosphate/aromatic aminotransferase/cobyric acid decarboxylase-like protein
LTSRLISRPPASHGGGSPRPIDLSASLNPLGPSPLALEAARSADLTRYPDPAAAPLAGAAAARHGLPAETMVPVPGASWGLWLCLVAHGGRGRRCLAMAPCFGEYRRYAEIAGSVYEETRSDLEVAVTARPDVLVLGNPANPTGATLPAGRLRAACDEHPGTLFVVDEAFAAFAPPGTSLVEGEILPPNVIVVRSLTKELGLPGLRMGYLVAAPERAAQLRGVLPAWPLSAPALAAAVAGCGDLDHIRAGAATGRRHVASMTDALVGGGAEVRPSSANYVLCRAPWLVRSLAARGIAGRDCGSFGLPGWVRLAAPKPVDLPAVLEGIGG